MLQNISYCLLRKKGMISPLAISLAKLQKGFFFPQFQVRARLQTHLCCFANCYLYVCQLTLGAPVVEVARITQWSVRLELVLPSVLQLPAICRVRPCMRRTRARTEKKLFVCAWRHLRSPLLPVKGAPVRRHGRSYCWLFA